MIVQLSCVDSVVIDCFKLVFSVVVSTVVKLKLGRYLVHLPLLSDILLQEGYMKNVLHFLFFGNSSLSACFLIRFRSLNSPRNFAFNLRFYLLLMYLVLSQTFGPRT